MYASWYFEIDDASVDIYISISSEHLLFLDKRAVVFQVQDRQQFTLAKLLSTTPNMEIGESRTLKISKKGNAYPSKNFKSSHGGSGGKRM